VDALKKGNNNWNISLKFKSRDVTLVKPINRDTVVRKTKRGRTERKDRHNLLIWVSISSCFCFHGRFEFDI
jgi:hypothetical protein